MNIIKLNATASSNDWLKDRFLTGDCFDGDVVWVRNQTQGRGQRNKHWQTEPMKNLTFSLFKLFSRLRVKNAFAINCAVTLAVIEALGELANIDLMLKWPNDILSHDKKIAGILIELILKKNTIDKAIIGIGLNTNQLNFKDLPRASSLKSITGVHYDLDELLHKFLENLKHYFSIEDRDQLWATYENVLFRKDKPSTFVDRKGVSFSGIIKGVSQQGKLIVKTEEKSIQEFDLKSIQLMY